MEFLTHYLSTISFCEWMLLAADGTIVSRESCKLKPDFIRSVVLTREPASAADDAIAVSTYAL